MKKIQQASQYAYETDPGGCVAMHVGQKSLCVIILLIYKSQTHTNSTASIIRNHTKTASPCIYGKSGKSKHINAYRMQLEAKLMDYINSSQHTHAHTHQCASKFRCQADAEVLKPRAKNVLRVSFEYLICFFRL